MRALLKISDIANLMSVSVTEARERVQQLDFPASINLMPHISRQRNHLVRWSAEAVHEHLNMSDKLAHCDYIYEREQLVHKQTVMTFMSVNSVDTFKLITTHPRAPKPRKIGGREQVMWGDVLNYYHFLAAENRVQ